MRFWHKPLTEQRLKQSRVIKSSTLLCTELGSILNMRQVLLYRDEDGYWVAECPSLPGCVSQGKTKEEALENIREAIQGYIRALQEDNIPVPS